MKSIITKIMLSVAIMGLTTMAYSSQSSMTINPNALGKNAVGFLKEVDSKTEPYLRVLRRQSQISFDALQLAVYMNQSENMEKKMDILIREIRKSNDLLAKLVTEKSIK